MNRFLIVLFGLIVVAGIVGIAWYHLREPAPAEVPVATASAPAPAAGMPAASAAPELRVPDQSGADAAFVLPALGDSDAAMRHELEGLVGRAPVESYLIPDQIIRRWVSFIDSLDGDGVPLAKRPARHVAGVPVVVRDGERIMLGTANAQRYRAYVAIIEAVDADKLVTLYFRYYPLFQRAYEELGYGQRYFNTRLLEVIDHLLATPVVEGPIELVRPKVLYQYADPNLESLSYGRKMLIRMGPENEAAVKAKLREIRAAIVARAKSPAAGGE